MSENLPIKNIEHDSLFSGLGSSMALSALMTGGFGTLSAVKSNKGVVKALKQTYLSNQTINEFLKNSKTNKDIFTKSYAAARNYEAYNSAIKSAKNAEKALAKITKKGAPTIWQRIKNIGKSSDAIVEKYKAKSIKANDLVDSMTKKLKNGEEIIDAKILSKSLRGNAKALFKQELLNPLNLLYAFTSTYSRIKEEAIPVFKEKGTLAGIKQVAVSVGKSAADIVSNAGFSAIFRIAGSFVGRIAGPAGAAIGGTIGDIFGTFLSNKVIVKLFGEDKASKALKNSDAVEVQNNTKLADSPNTNNAGLPINIEDNNLYAYAEKVRKEANSHRIGNRLYV